MVDVKQDFIDKKENLADLIEGYMVDNQKEKELLEMVSELSSDDEFKNKDLFKGIFVDIIKYLSELSRKELKQRVLMIRSYID